MATSEGRIEQIRQQLEERREKLQTASGKVTDARLAFRQAAALLTRFDPTSLRPAHQVEGDKPALVYLIRDSDTVGESGKSLWSLKPEIRHRTLTTIEGPEAALAALQANSTGASSELGKLLASLLSGEPLKVEGQSSEQLALAIKAVRWLSLIPGVESLPTEQELRAALERQSLLEPFEQLVQDGFEGRTREMDRLRNHVGVLQPVSVMAKISRAGSDVGRLFRRGKERPLMVRGPGGIGKSTLIAKFILDHLKLPPEVRFPTAYFDFERPSITAVEPMTLIAEAARQLAIHYPDLGEQYLALEARCQAEIQKRAEDKRSIRELRSANTTEQTQRASQIQRNLFRRENRLLKKLAGLLRRASGERGQQDEVVRDLAGTDTRQIWIQGSQVTSSRDLLKLLVARLEPGAPAPKLPRAPASRWTSLAVSWLLARLEPVNEPLLLILDGFEDSTLGADIEEFVAELASQLADGRAPGTTLLLLGYPGDLPKEATKKPDRVVIGSEIQGAPFLMVLDSFERSQYRSSSELLPLRDLLRELQRVYPMVRVVISGRAPTRGLDLKQPDLVMEDFDRDPAVSFLLKRSEFTPEVAESLVDEYKGNPLTLRLLAKLGEEKPLDETEKSEARKSASSWWPRSKETVDDALVQAMLYDRILKQIDSDEVRQLAHPGLVLRRITPAIIEDVLADHCDVEVGSYERAVQLFNAFERQVDLVELLEPQVLGHRPEVRRVMLKLMQRDQEKKQKDKNNEGAAGSEGKDGAPSVLDAIEQAAIDHYRTQPGPQARAEEIYHRLRLRQPPEEVERLWEAGVEHYLSAEVIDEVPEEAQPLLESRLRGIAEEGTTFYEERLAERAEALLSATDLDEALELLADQSRWSGSSELYILKAEVLTAMERTEEAGEVVAEGILSATLDLRLEPESQSSLALLVRLHRLAASLANTGSAADEHLAAAERLSTDLQSDIDQLQNLFNRWRSRTREGGAADAETARIGDRLTRLFLDQPAAELATRPALVAAIGSEVGLGRVEVLATAIQVIEWPRQLSGGRALARELGFLARESEEFRDWLTEWARVQGLVLQSFGTDDISGLLSELAQGGKVRELLSELVARSDNGSVLRERLSEMVAATSSVTSLEAHARAKAYLAGEALSFEEVDELWQELKATNELSLSRAILERLRAGDFLLDGLPRGRDSRQALSRQHALLTSEDPDLDAASRYEEALDILGEEFDLDDEGLDGDAETLGIAGGIHKRRWEDLGQIEDLRRASELYQRAIGDDLGADAYAHVNAAFLEDLLAQAGDSPESRRARADALRRKIVKELVKEPDNWWNAATRAEAHLGLGQYKKAIAAIQTPARPNLWQLETTARQLSRLANARQDRPLEVPEIRQFFEELLGGSVGALNSAFLGKVGLALSGSGFRAAFYHLGILARLADVDLLRHIEVLSCVSGGSIVGAGYWLSLRRRLLEEEPMGRGGYVRLVQGLIEHFEGAVAGGLDVSRSRLRTIYRLFRDQGAIDSAELAEKLEEKLFRPLLPGEGPLYMHQLPFTPSDHDPQLTGSPVFDPRSHNWLREDKIPELVIHATTANTGHAWRFTPKWMGEAPWAAHESADGVPRLEPSPYEPAVGWQVRLAEAVVASISVPGLFSPLILDDAYEELRVELINGGVSGSLGTGALLASGCNLLLVGDGGNQLLLEQSFPSGLEGLTSFAYRSFVTLDERTRQARYADLTARRHAGLLRGLSVVHLKDGLEADAFRLRFSHLPVRVRRSLLTRAGVRREFQQALAELRTDLSKLTPEETRGLMACGYQMARESLERDLGTLDRSIDDGPSGEWPFAAELKEITSTATTTARREELLRALREGSQRPV